MNKIIAEYPTEMIGSLTAVEGITTVGSITTQDLLGFTHSLRYRCNFVRDEIIPINGGFIIKHYRYDVKDLLKKCPINQDIFMLDVDSQVIWQIYNKNDKDHHLQKLPKRVCHRKGCDLCSKQCLLVPEFDVNVPYCLARNIPNAVKQEYPLS